MSEKHQQRLLVNYQKLKMKSSVSSAASSNGALGQLQIKAVLDNEDRVHYGQDDPVRGSVLVRYVSLSRVGTSQLFGPLRLDVVLRGQSCINHEDEPSRIKTLFTKTQTIHDGAFRADNEQQERIPFGLQFPENADPSSQTTMIQNENGSWSLRTSVNTDVHSLPPSLESQAQEHTSVSKLKSGSQTLVGVSYSLLVRAKMPGLEVDLAIADAQDGLTILYDRPRVPMMIASNLADSSEFSRQLTVQNEGLRSSEQKPRGFVGKTKAFFRSAELPKYVFTATCSNVPQHAFVGQPIAFDISVASHFSSTTQIDPDIFLDGCTTLLIARTAGVRPVNIERLWSKEADVERKPFSDRHGWTKVIDIGTLGCTPSTFSFGDIERSYKMRIAFQLSVGKQKMIVRQDMPIMIHPPISEIDNALARINSDGSALPAYEEAAAIGMTPSYEAATATSTPSYDQAISECSAHYDPTAELMRGGPSMGSHSDVLTTIQT